MVRIDCLVFGYRKLKISGDDLSRVTSIFINNGISSTINNDGTIIVRERDFTKIQNLLQGRIEFIASEPKGLYGRWKKFKYKKTLIFSLVISAMLFAGSTSLVWDIRIVGNESIPDSEIILGLSHEGFEVGSLWGRVDKSVVESSFLKQNSNISWININRRGMVAYVTVLERSDEEYDDVQSTDYANIVATEDCVVEEITVKSGTAVVKPGDVVKKGDLLISGISPGESGGFCKAEGTVIGRVNEKIDVNLMRNHKLRVPSGRKIYSISLNFFNFSLNIFKLYRNLTNECDIIDCEKSYSLFGKAKLPFSINIKYITDYNVEYAEYSNAEMVNVAASRLNGLIASRLTGCDLIKAKTFGHYTDNGYYLCSDVTFLCSVGVTKKFEVD